MKRVVITGATSMLGAALVEECLRHSIEVIAIVRRGSKKLFRLPSSDRVRVIECDLDEMKNFLGAANAPAHEGRRPTENAVPTRVDGAEGATSAPRQSDDAPPTTFLKETALTSKKSESPIPQSDTPQTIFSAELSADVFDNGTDTRTDKNNINVACPSTSATPYEGGAASVALEGGDAPPTFSSTPTVLSFDELRADVFYHFAWGSTGSSTDPVDPRRDAERQALNIQFTLDAVRLAHRLGCRKFLFAGSQAEYGATDQPLNRSTPVKPTMAYGIAKYSAGRLAEILCRTLGIDFVHMRILSVYGVNDGANTLISYLVRSYLDNVRPQLTGCAQLWDYLYSDDAARCFRLLGESERARGVYCVGSGRARPLRDYVEIIHRLTGSTVPLIFGERPYAPDQVMRLEADITDLRRDVGFEPTISFEEGISRIISARRLRH